VAATLLAAAYALHWVSKQSEPVHAAGFPAFLPTRLDRKAAQSRQTAQASTGELSVRVDVRPAQKALGPEDDPAKACRLDFAEESAPWSKWIDLGGTKLEAKSSEETVPVQAVRIPNGVALLAVNHSDRKAALQLSCKASRGIFTVARLSFATKQDASTCHVERLQSVLLKGSGTLIKPAWLMPETGVVFRITNETRELGDALADVNGALRAIAGSAPRAVRLIRGPLSDASGKITHIVWEGGAAERDRTAKAAEGAALSLSHAQTLFRNNRSSGALHGPKAEALGVALDRLDSALSEIMAGSLDLVPNAELGDAEQDKQNSSSLNVLLSNQGSRTLRMVKLEPVAPEDVRVSPEDPAVFRFVRPGETVRATFIIQPSGEPGSGAFHADISYIAGRAPAHLRIRAF
jgi:hypothetical protein